MRIICNSFFQSWNWEIWKKNAKLTRKVFPRDCWQQFEVWLLFKKFRFPLDKPSKKTSPKVNWFTDKYLTLTWCFSGKYARILVAWFLHETTWYVQNFWYVKGSTTIRNQDARSWTLIQVPHSNVRTSKHSYKTRRPGALRLF